ncbi:hypothetical protein ACQ4PT_030394 [Festuca glaucescens]
MDIDCMPLHPLENFPLQNIVNKYYRSFPEVKFEDRSTEYGGGGAARFVPNGDTFDSVAHAKNTGNEATVAAQQAMYSQPCTLSQLQEREADIRALADLSHALDKKGNFAGRIEAHELRGVRKQYAMVLVQLRDSNDHESGSQVMEIIETLRCRAKAMVDVAIQEIWRLCSYLQDLKKASDQSKAVLVPRHRLERKLSQKRLKQT